MTIHPEIAKILSTLPAPDGSPLDPRAMRAGEAAQVPRIEDRLPLRNVEDTTAVTESGEVPVRIYTPAEADAYGILVYFHGGAFFLGSLDTHDHVARSLAKESGYKVISVGYRLAPEAAFPAGLQDCYGVVRWAAGQGESLNWDGKNLAIAGDSSGGNFVAAVAAMAHDDGFGAITHQVLFYPSLDLDFDVDRYASLRENAEGYGLETAGLKPFNAFYLDSGADPADPLVSPIKRRDLAGLPAALVITAEHDPLRDEGELYGRRLREAGVDAAVSRYAGANHGFVQNFSWIPEFYGVFEETAAFLRGTRRSDGSRGVAGAQRND
ncbi:alpha/beta hydrolase [uncultured Arthrobacter sp.]|uniref:alpha/beta hydrolase n=1 Tax=uncultured Arthrobacter sp. TaxID=114050 RepID=UPI0032180983